MAVTIVRVPGGLDYSWVTDEEISKIPANGNLTVTSNGTSDPSAALECLPVESPHLPRKFIINEKITKSPRLMLKKKEPTSQTKEEYVKVFKFGNI
mgnify:FL=1